MISHITVHIIPWRRNSDRSCMDYSDNIICQLMSQSNTLEVEWWRCRYNEIIKMYRKPDVSERQYATIQRLWVPWLYGMPEITMKSSKDFNELPPPYDQATTIDVESGTAPLLRETFSGSIFGTSTIVTFEIAADSETIPNILSDCYERPKDYSFVIRDFLGCVQANGRVANTSDDLNTTLMNVRLNEILQFRKRFPSSVDTIQSAMVKPDSIHTFEITTNRTPIGLVKFAHGEPTETCLKIFIGNGESELLVKSLTMGEFVIFRDESSSTPLCNIVIEPMKFNGKIIFHPETGITTDEQLLCTAAAFAYKTCSTRLDISESNRYACKLWFWFLFTFFLTLFVSFLILYNV